MRSASSIVLVMPFNTWRRCRAPFVCVAGFVGKLHGIAASALEVDKVHLEAPIGAS